jgi:hypothetical protein
VADESVKVIIELWWQVEEASLHEDTQGIHRSSASEGRRVGVSARTHSAMTSERSARSRVLRGMSGEAGRPVVTVFGALFRVALYYALASRPPQPPRRGFAVMTGAGPAS